MSSFEEFLEAQPAGEGAWRYRIGPELHGAFGGAFGGFLAAACIHTARSAAPGRVPNALDCRFVRGLRKPGATVTATILHFGRSLSNVSVDLTDDNGKLCTRATVSLVDADVLQPVEITGPEHGRWTKHGDVKPWPAIAPIVTAIDSRILGSDERGIATGVRIPWDISPETSAEAAAVAADMAVGPPLGSAMSSAKVSTPNPDISMRFCGEVTSPIIVGVGRLDRAHGGVAAVHLEVWSDDEIVAIGISTALMLPAG